MSVTIRTIMGDDKKEKDENVQQRFGKYFILDHLVDGGMAKIYRARFLGEEADKLIAIKMIKTQFSSDENFKRMFLDELNVIFGFEHPNVVNTFDYGMNKGQLYVAMEYCDGKSVNEYISKVKKQNCHIPIDVTLSVVSQICRGLHYVHKFRDKLTGKKKDVIHRDISPHNIMLGYEGSVKVIDFGIAKVNADNKAKGDATQAGSIKGKISYLAPEYIEGMELDHRYDQFATGITLWEMLCNRKLFEGSNTIAVLKKIQECEIPPPSSINPNVPKELDDIVMKTLSRERNERHENMDQLDRALTKLLNKRYPDFHSSDVGYFAENLFKSEIEKDRESLFKYGQIDIKPYIEELKREQKKSGGTSPSLGGVTSPTATKTRRAIAIFDFEEKGEGRTKKYINSNDAYDDELLTGASFGSVSIKIKKAMMEKGKMERKKNQEKRKLNGRTGAGKFKKKHEWQKVKRVQLGKVKVGLDQEEDELDPESENFKPDYEWQKNKKNPKQDSKVKWIKIAAGVVVACLVSWVLLLKVVKKPQKISDTEESRTERKSASLKKEKATLILDNFNRFEQTLFVNGQKMEVDIYSRAILEPQDNTFIRIESKNKRPHVVRIDLASGEKKRLNIPVQEREDFAKLRAVGRECPPNSSLEFVLYGEKRVLTIPFSSLYSFPLKGDGEASISERGFAIYELTVVYQNGGRKKVNVEFQSTSQPVNVCSRL